MDLLSLSDDIIGKCEVWDMFVLLFSVFCIAFLEHNMCLPVNIELLFNNSTNIVLTVARERQGKVVKELSAQQQ